MKRLLILTICLLGPLLPASAQSHGHINAGAIDSNSSGAINAGDKLFMYFEPGTQTTTLLANSGTGVYGGAGYQWNGYTTFTSLHQSTDPTLGLGADYSPVGAVSGSYLVLSLVSVTGPVGATFSFFETSGTSPSIAYQIGTGFLAGSATSFNLTQDDYFTFDPSDPFGHIHGRMFGVTLPGDYTATWILQDTQSATTGLLNSDAFTSSFTTVPEPSTWALLVLALVLLCQKVIRRRGCVARVSQFSDSTAR